METLAVVDESKIEIQLAQIIIQQQVIIEKLEERTRQHEQLASKVATIESRINMAAGAIAVITAGVTFLFQYLLQKIKGA